MSGSSSSNSNSSQRRRSQNTSSSSGPVDECRCGMKLPVLTAWTDQNRAEVSEMPKLWEIMRLEDEIYWFKRRENCLKDELIEYQKREKSLESIVIDCKRIENNLRAEIADFRRKERNLETEIMDCNKREELLEQELHSQRNFQRAVRQTLGVLVMYTLGQVVRQTCHSWRLTLKLIVKQPHLKVVKPCLDVLEASKMDFQSWGQNWIDFQMKLLKADDVATCTAAVCGLTGECGVGPCPAPALLP
ncbi:hypothetical protein BUALT_Bualt11G0102900 [Buddleja alternifolia]|uniref:Uncharacterized protein n=1 Tax=Buddleja alternifolia TaxID=168488 RepID=A0AAV6WVP3_9LAMI|nr:hypothetical protein BUALT_Bualt11G0102900 [Buddleja alternifolia]